MPHAIVAQARPVAGLGQPGDRVVEAHQEAARVGGVEQGALHLRGLEVQDGLEIDVLRERLAQGDAAAILVELVGDLVQRPQRQGHPFEVVHDERREIDQEALAVGVRLAFDLRLPDHGIGHGDPRGGVHGRSGRRLEEGVPLDQLDRLADAVEGDHVLRQHVGRVDEVLADAGDERRVEQEGRLELVRGDLEQVLSLVFLDVEVEQPLQLPGPLDGLLEGRLLRLVLVLLLVSILLVAVILGLGSVFLVLLVPSVLGGAEGRLSRARIPGARLRHAEGRGAAGQVGGGRGRGGRREAEQRHDEGDPERPGARQMIGHRPLHSQGSGWTRPEGGPPHRAP